MIFRVLDFKKGVQSLRLQRLSVIHSLRKNVQDFAKLLIFFDKVNNENLEKARSQFKTASYTDV
jgi:hypothetical protein